MLDIAIRYLVVEETDEQHFTVFHLLSEAEITLLRCFMTLLLLPTSTGQIIADQRPFVQAITRLRQLPSFRKASSGKQPPPELWDGLLNFPLVVVMAGYSLPS